MRFLVFALLLAFSCTFAVNAQTVDTALLGTVLDSGGAVISGASVIVTEPATGLVRSAVTTEGGAYEFRYLVPGEYTIEVRNVGFRTVKRTGVVIQIGQQSRIDFSMQLGAVEQAIEVQASTPLLQTESATLAGVVGQERIENLPINGRKFGDLAILTPGIQVRNPDLHSSSTDGSQISGNGGRPIWGQVNVDGITMVNNRHNYVNLYPSLDAIQEFKVQTGNYSAEYGGNAGTNVNIQIKSGTNRYHGDVFEFFRNQAMDARDYFLPPPLPQNILKQNQFGATLGGAVRKDKTFFFLSYEGMRSISESPSQALVLTEAQRNGDFSSLFANDGTADARGNPTGQLYNPATGNPIPGNNLAAAGLIDTVAQNIINKYMPLPNLQPVLSNPHNYAGSSLGDLTVHQAIVRVDQYFSQRDQLFAHYIFGHREFPNRDLNPNFNFTGTYPIHNFQTQYIHTFAPTLFNEFRGGFDLENVSVLSTHTNTDFTIESLGINGLKVGGPNGRPLRRDEEGFPVLNISGYLGMGDDKAASNLDNSRTYQFVDTLSWLRGAHTFKFGGDVRRLYDDATTNNWPFSNMNFTGDISGNAAADYMLGYPRTVLTPEGVPITAAQEWRYAFYAQDDWKVAHNLTLNLGLRYDLFGVPKDTNGVTRTLIFSANNPPVFFPAPGKVIDDLWKIGHKDFSPRIGFAYSVKPNMVVRGGYGIFYFGGQFDNINILQLNPTAAGSITITNPAINPVATIENPIPAALYPKDPIFNAVTLPADNKHPDTYVQDWNLQISRQFGGNDVFEIGYVGSKGTHVDTSLDNFNQPAPGAGDIQARRPFPQFGRIRNQSFGVNTMYHSLQARFEHRLSKDLSVTAAYTWSHLIDNAAQTINDGSCGCQNPLDLRAERASGIFDQRHLLVLGYVWELPIARGKKGFMGTALGGWGFEGIITLASGHPFDVLESFDSQNNDGIWERPTLVAGQKLTVSHRDPSLWFNTNAFQASNLVFGNSPRDPLVGPGTHVFDLSLRKSFRIPHSEHQSLQFRVEAFNAFNTPQFSNPDSSLGDSGFGTIQSTKSPNRQIQLVLKYIF